MTGEKSMCLLVFLITLFKGNYFLNSTQTQALDQSLSKILLENETFIAGGLNSGNNESNTKITLTSPERTQILDVLPTTGINSTHVKQSEIIEIFRGTVKNGSGTNETAINSIIVKDCVNVSSENATCSEPSWNNTAKTNYTLMAEAAEALNLEIPTFRLEKSVAIATGVFLVSAVIGYLSCVGYRRFLQRKYGNSQVLIAEEVYDTTDLRYFEI